MIEVTKNNIDFSKLHERIQWYVDENIIPFANTLVMRGTDVLDVKMYGMMDHESGKPLQEDSIFRVHSCTKIVTSIAAMQLWEEGRFALDDPLERYLPEFSDMEVLTPDACTAFDVEPARDSIRINQILSHTAGLSYGFVEPDSIIDQAYLAAGLSPFDTDSVETMTLQSLCEGLGEMPLVYEPGTFWRYSFGTDVTARLVEVISGQRFDHYLKERILEPLGMFDTDFYVPEQKRDRFVTMYYPADPMDPMSKGFALGESAESGTHTSLPSFLNGGAGLTSTLIDFLAFARMIVNEGSYEGKQIIKPETLSMMRTNQCAEGVVVNFPMWDLPGTTFGLGFALKNKPGEGEPESATGEYHWGGIAGAHLWFSPRANLTGICMTNRMPAFLHPYSHEFKRLAYELAGS